MWQPKSLSHTNTQPYAAVNQLTANSELLDIGVGHDVHLHDVASCQRLRLIRQGREVADAVVDRQAGGERDALLHLLLLLEALRALLRDDAIAECADFGDVLAILALHNHTLQGNCNTATAQVQGATHVSVRRTSVLRAAKWHSAKRKCHASEKLRHTASSCATQQYKPVCEATRASVVATYGWQCPQQGDTSTGCRGWRCHRRRPRPPQP